MNLIKAIKSRRSIRKFDPTKQVSSKQIQKLLDVARFAPSAGNLQSYHIYIVKEKTLKKQLSYQEALQLAPIAFVICAYPKQSASKYGHRGQTLYAIQDATLAAYTLWLAAIHLNLAAVWIGSFDETEVKNLLNIPSDLHPIAILPVGYPAESPTPPPRKSIAEISTLI